LCSRKKLDMSFGVFYCVLGRSGHVFQSFLLYSRKKLGMPFRVVLLCSRKKVGISFKVFLLCPRKKWACLSEFSIVF
jgi:hypothetical protein